MPGDTPAEAVEDFVHPLRQVAQLVTDSQLFPSGWHEAQVAHSVSFRDAPATPLRGTNIALDFRHWYRVVRDSEPVRGPFRVSSVGYLYSLLASDGRELASFHWHPDDAGGVVTPHVHLPHREPWDLTGLHLPTDRISFEYVVRLAIEHFGARARPGWEEVLRRTEERFRRVRGWPRP